jgi:hypothetical protein
VGGKSFKRKKKKNWVGAGEKIKFQKKNLRSGGKTKLGRGPGENKVAKKTEIKAEKCQTKKVNLGWHRDRKENPITAPSIRPVIHPWMASYRKKTLPEINNPRPLCMCSCLGKAYLAPGEGRGAPTRH